jgi:2-iminobutanoate/2-iminopropanoate deaminase
MRLCRASQGNEMNSFLKSAIAIGGLALSFVPAVAENDGVKFYNSPAAAAAKLPFSQVVRVGNVLYMSGAIGVLPGKMELVPGGIEPETKQVMNNIREVLNGKWSNFR